MVLVIDHFDSFVYNLSRYIHELGYPVQVIRQDKVTIEAIHALQPSHIVLSPGPCSPNEAGISIEVVNTFIGRIPMLGVCLGHQIIGQVMGGNVARAKRPLHGQGCLLHHQGEGLFRGIPSPCLVGRYHSLIVEDAGLSDKLEVVARSEEGEIMAFVSSEHQLAGVQFHPESVITTHGHQMLQNFLHGIFV
jgi:para-aminobenzoate synthetase component 2